MVGPWKGVRDLDDPFAVPTQYLGFARNTYIPDPAGGAGVYARPGFKELTLALQSTTTPSDAIVAPSIEFIDGMDLGIMQSLGGAADADRATFQAGRWGSVFGTFAWHATGGRDNGGWLEVIAADPNVEDLDRPLSASLGVAQWNPLLPSSLQGESDDPSQNPVIYPWMGLFVGLNQRGVVPDGRTGLLGAGLFNAPDHASLHGYPRFVIRPDYGIDLIGCDFAPGNVVTDYLLYSSPAGIVPVASWYGVEIQVGLNPTGIDAGGFALLTVYREADGPLGVEVVKQVGVRTGSITTHSMGEPTSATGFTLIPLYLQPGTGVDDFAYYEPTGTKKGWLRDLNIEGCPPIADVGTPGSIVAVTQHQTAGTPPVDYGGTFRFGSDDRSANLSIANSESRPSSDPEADKQFSIGTVSGNTGLWLDGPHAPPTDPIVSNKVYDTAKDLFSIAPQRTRGTVVCVGMAIRGGSVLRAIAPDLEVLFGDEFGAAGPFINVHGTENASVDPPGLDDVTTNWRALVRPIIRSGSAEYSTYPYIGHDSHGGGSHPGWSAIYQYWPPSRHIAHDDPSLSPGSGWTLGAALGHLIGYVGDPTIDIPSDIQTPPDPPLHHVVADIIGLASEIVYHATPFTEPDVPLFHPVCAAALLHWGGPDGDPVNADGELAGIYEVCADFNDGPSHITDHVTVTVDFGDGSSPQTFAGPGIVNVLEHTFQRAGDLTITVTATNAHSLSATQTFAVTVPNRAPTAAFSFAVHSGDMTGYIIDFTNGSSDPDGDTLTYAWDFDFLAHPGVHTSTSTSPTFDYTALGAGAHTAKLTVDDGNGHAVSTTHVVTVPIGGGVTWELDEQFPDADDAAFAARVNADTDYDTDYTDTRLIGCTLDNAVQFHGHQSMKVDVQAGGGILDLYHHTPDLRDYWTAIALRFPATFYQGNLSDATITTALDMSEPMQLNAWSNDGSGGGGFDQFIQTAGLNVHGGGGTPVVYSPFEADGDDFDEFVYDNDEASSGRVVTATIPFATMASDGWILIATRTTTTTNSIRNRSWYSTDDGATWTLLTDESLSSGDLGGDTVLPSGWFEFQVTHTAALHAGDVIHVGMLQIADATLPGNSDPYGIGP